jgi:DeoR family glycerol-3-phosphate regulon repressor
MLRNARRSIMLADHSKFTRVATARLAGVGEFDTLVTDRQPSPAISAMIEKSGCELIIASETGIASEERLPTSNADRKPKHR